MKCSFFQPPVVSILLYECTTATTQECCERYWKSPGGSTPQRSSCTATYHPSRKLSKLDEADMQGHCWRSKDGFVEDELQWTTSHGRVKAGRSARTRYCSSVPIRDVALKTCQKQWMSGEKGSGRSIVMVQHNDNDDDRYSIFESPRILLIYLTTNFRGEKQWDNTLLQI